MALAELAHVVEIGKIAVPSHTGGEVRDRNQDLDDSGPVPTGGAGAPRRLVDVSAHEVLRSGLSFLRGQ